MKTTTIILVLAWLSFGCASLRPPAHDREAWEAEQAQAAARNEAALEQDPFGMTLYFGYAAYCLSEIGFILAK